MQRVACLAALACSSSCIAVQVPEPPVSVQTAEGEVRASNREDAERVAALLVELAPKVREILVETRAEPPQVYVLEWDVPKFGDGSNYDGRILMNGRSRPRERFCLAHELVHWQIAGAWELLPHTAQEGLADRVAAQLAPETRVERELMLAYQLQWGSLRDPMDALKLSTREWSGVRNTWDRFSLYGVGYFIVARIGIEDLHAMCAEAKAEERISVLPMELLERARLSPYDVREWKADIDAIVFADPGAIAAWSDEVKRPGEVRATQPR